MSEDSFMGVPRVEVPWFPTIDYERCDFCMECDEFCPHGVFQRREGEEKRLVVARPGNCVVFCRVCARACPLDALSFPDKKETTELIKRLREGAPVESATGIPRGVSMLEFKHDKYIFRVPEDGYFFNENDCWARPEGGVARIGVSDYVQQSASDIVLFEPPGVGSKISIFEEAGHLESTKTALDIISPVSGTVVAVNEELLEAPELINDDPYVRGWAVELELSDFGGDRRLLMDCRAYFQRLQEKVAVELAKKNGGHGR